MSDIVFLNYLEPRLNTFMGAKVEDVQVFKDDIPIIIDGKPLFKKKYNEVQLRLSPGLNYASKETVDIIKATSQEFSIYINKGLILELPFKGDVQNFRTITIPIRDAISFVKGVMDLESMDLFLKGEKRSEVINEANEQRRRITDKLDLLKKANAA